MQEEIQNDNKRLIDEALLAEPIKNTFRLGWEFITINQKFTLTVLGTFILLHLLGTIPILSLIFIVVSGVFGLAIQIYMGRVFYTTQNINSYVKEIEESTLEKLSNTTLAPALGAYMGWIVFLLAFLVLFSILLGMTGLVNEGMNESDLLTATLSVAFPLLTTLLLLSYVQPLVHANITLSKNFKEGFTAVFTIFSVDVWRRAFNKTYFNYVAILGTVTLGIMLLLVILLQTIGLSLELSFITNILLLGAIYIFIIIMAVGSMMAKRIVDA